MTSIIPSIKNPLIKAQKFPSLIKYMGSKSKIIDFIVEGINEVHQGGAICDLFTGSATLAGAIGQQAKVHSNDIQAYSGILSGTYNQAYRSSSMPTSEELRNQAEQIVVRNRDSIGCEVTFGSDITLEQFNELESKQQQLLSRDFERSFHLFVKNYSGTWWSVDQCLWIDALREVAEQYKNESYYAAILASIMYAMAYCSQGTGHYAQFRDAKNDYSMSDILIYRRRDLGKFFERKYKEIYDWLPSQKPYFDHQTTNLNFKECLDVFEGGTVYADPPYCFVHYSRFYHAIETLVLYDYPDLQYRRGKIVKGRYRVARHQSPFCIKTKVNRAFQELFDSVKKSNSNLVLSYSNTGMIEVDKVLEMAKNTFQRQQVWALEVDHKHMTMGRLKDRHREVKECLVMVK